MLIILKTLFSELKCQNLLNKEKSTIGDLKMVLISEKINDAFNTQIGEEIS